MHKLPLLEKEYTNKMKTQISLITLLLVSFLNLKGQTAEFMEVVESVCDTVKKIETPIDELGLENAKQLLVHGINRSNSIAWLNELDRYKAENKGFEYGFNQYFYYLIQSECPDAREFCNLFDNYLKDDSINPHYLKVKEFANLLEDHPQIDSLTPFFSKEVESDTLSKILAFSKTRIDHFEGEISRNIVLVYVDGYTFKVRYFGYRSDDPEFHMYVNFRNADDLLFDSIEIRDKDYLMEEKRERLEFSKKVQEGKLSLPPPPPPRKRNNN